MLPENTIDVHAHYLPPVYREALRAAGLTLLDGGMPVPAWSPEQALELMDQIGVCAAVLSITSPFISFVAQGEAPRLSRAINEYSANLRDRFPERFGAYAILPMPDIDACLAELAHAMDVLQLDGVCLPTNAEGIYLGDPRLDRLMDALAERGTTVFVHPTVPCCFEAVGLGLPGPMIEFPFDTTRTIASLLFAGRLEQRRKIRFIFSHAGGTMPFIDHRLLGLGSSVPVRHDAAVPIDMAQSALRDFHYDLALSSRAEQLFALRAVAPISQILFGTDYPFSPAAVAQRSALDFEGLPLSAAERKAIAVDNAIRLFPVMGRRCCGHRHGQGQDGAPD